MVSKMLNLPIPNILCYAAVIIFLVNIVSGLGGQTYMIFNANYDYAHENSKLITGFIMLFASEFTRAIWQPFILFALAKIIQILEEKK